MQWEYIWGVKIYTESREIYKVEIYTKTKYKTYMEKKHIESGDIHEE